MIKARDVVRLGLDGHRWGLPIAVGSRRRRIRARIDELLAAVGATDFGDSPVSMLSGGELQRIRVAAALASDPVLLLCDEPLAALDLRHQQDIAALIDQQRRRLGTAVLFVTHDINPVLPYVDQVLYLAGARSGSAARRGADLGRPVRALRRAGGRAPGPGPDHRGVLDRGGRSPVSRRPRRDRAGRRVAMSIWDKIFNFADYGQLLALLHNSILAGAVLGLVGGLIGVFVMMRDLTFAVHGISELSFAGASFALLVGMNVVVGSIMGSLLAAVVIGVLGVRARERSSIIGS